MESGGSQDLIIKIKIRFIDSTREFILICDSLITEIIQHEVGPSANHWRNMLISNPKACQSHWQTNPMNWLWTRSASFQQLGEGKQNSQEQSGLSAKATYGTTSAAIKVIGVIFGTQNFSLTFSNIEVAFHANTCISCGSTSLLSEAHRIGSFCLFMTEGTWLCFHPNLDIDSCI